MGEVYCVCRTGDSRGFMIYCERCEDWFHGHCIGLSKKKSKLIDKWYCDECLRIDKSLKIVYYPITPTKIKKENKPVTRPPNLKQCENPTCTDEARKKSNYCSDKCGLELAKQRLIRHYIPKWSKLTDIRTEIIFKEEMKNLEAARLEHTRKVDEIVESLYKLERDIKSIKETARAKQPEKDEAAVSEEEEEDAEVTKTYCVTCGLTILSDNAFKHWSNCFKKQEVRFNVSSGCECTFGPPENRHPPVFCETLNPRTQQYCKRFRGICAEHPDPDLVDIKKDENEVCGCPLNIQQELVLDGNYCQEKKSECTVHYQWDKFRKAQLNLTRLYHYFKLEEINEKLRVCSNNLEDCHGGIIGLMLHTTKNETR